MAVIDRQNCLEDIIFRDDIPTIGGGMVAGGRQRMGVGFEQSA